MTEPESHWQCVLSTGDILLLGLAKSILDAEKIKYVVEGELLQDLVGPGRIGLGYNQVAGPIEVWVSGDQVEEASQLLKDLRMEPGA
jgi:hypothetical protein